MTNIIFVRLATLLFLASILTLSACDSGNPDDHDEHFGQIEVVEVRELESGDLLAMYDRSLGNSFDSHIHLHPGDALEVSLEFFDEEGHEAHLGPGEEFSLGIRLAEENRDGVEGIEGIVAFDTHGDHADIEAIGEGTTWLVFQLMHGSHSDGDAPALEFEVVDHDHS